MSLIDEIDEDLFAGEFGEQLNELELFHATLEPAGALLGFDDAVFALRDDPHGRELMLAQLLLPSGASLLLAPGEEGLDVHVVAGELELPALNPTERLLAIAGDEDELRLLDSDGEELNAAAAQKLVADAAAQITAAAGRPALADIEEAQTFSAARAVRPELDQSGAAIDSV